MSDIKIDYERSTAKNEKFSYSQITEWITKLYDQRVKSKKRALIVKKPSQPFSSNQKSAIPFCRYCKKKSHWIANCPVLKEKKEKEASQDNSKLHLPSPKSRSNHTYSQSTNLVNTLTVQLSDEIELPEPLRMSNAVGNFNNVDEWLYDSAATNFMSPNKSDFNDLHLYNGPSYHTGNGLTQVCGSVTVKIRAFNGTSYTDMQLKDVEYIPSLPAPLFSEPMLGKMGIDSMTDVKKSMLQLMYKSKVIMTSTRDPITSEPFVMNFQIIHKSNHLCNVVLPIESMQTRLGHCPANIISKTIDNKLITNVTVDKSTQIKDCENCIQSKMVSRSNNHNLIKATFTPGSTIHCNTYSPRIKSFGNLLTAFIFVDESTRRVVFFVWSFACKLVNTSFM